jgi:hypothetical protein
MRRAKMGDLPNKLTANGPAGPCYEDALSGNQGNNGRPIKDINRPPQQITDVDGAQWLRTLITVCALQR